MEYTVIDAGERMCFEVGISYPENKARKDLGFEYNLLENGKVIAKSRFLKAVENQASFPDYIIVPVNAEDGIHEISDSARLHAFDGRVYCIPAQET